jgi:hypothetical protein
MPPVSYAARLSAAVGSPIMFWVSGVNLNNRQTMAIAVNPDDCLIRSIFLEPFHSPPQQDTGAFTFLHLGLV